MEWLAEPQTWIALVTLVALELVLGVDNVIFISILAGRLPANQQKPAIRTGLAVAVISRILLLCSLSWIIGLTAPLFSVLSFEIAGRDIVLFAGGLFLLGKATTEIHQRLEGEEGHASTRVKPSFAGVLVQVLVLDVVFSLDSVITAVGMVNQLPVMVAAVLTAAGLMIVVSGYVSDFVEGHPTIKMLALCFLLLIGFTLVVESLHMHIPKGYIYFAMAFSVLVEMLNLRLMGAREPLALRKPYVDKVART